MVASVNAGGWKRQCLTAFIRGNSAPPSWGQQSCWWRRLSIAMRRPAPSILRSSKQGSSSAPGAAPAPWTTKAGLRLSVSSFGFGTIGVSGGELVGTAHNLRTAADIAGTYEAAAAGLTVGAGGQVARFQNANGVILELVGAQLGLAVSLGSAGMTIALQAQ